MLAEASLQPHRSRYWKTATIDETFLPLAAKVLWCYERVAWLHERGEIVLCLDEKPNIQALSRAIPRQLMSAGRIERHEFEYQRHGTVTLVVALNVYDGTMRGWCVDKNDHEHFLWCVRQVARSYRHARRLHPRAHGAEWRAPEHRSREAQRAACRSAPGRRSRQALAAASAESEGP